MNKWGVFSVAGLVKGSVAVTVKVRERGGGGRVENSKRRRGK